MPEPDLDLLIDAARAAGDIACRHFNADPDVWEKSDGQGPVTEADLEIDAMLRAELMAARPDYGWLSEESEDSRRRQSAERVFIVDPIDGTRSFIARQKTWAHAIAVAEAGRVIAAVVHLPLRQKTYWAVQGHGAYLNGERISASDRDHLEGAAVLASRKHLSDQLWPGGPPPVELHFRSSLAYRMALVAQGRFDGMVTLRPSWEWDIAAGDLIVREAGGHVTDRTGAGLEFNGHDPRAKGVLAGSRPVVDGFLARL